MLSIIVIFRVHLREDDKVKDLISRARDLRKFVVCERLQQVKCLQRDEAICNLIRDFANSGIDNVIKMSLDSK